jgi:hypothetical protein
MRKNLKLVLIIASIVIVGGGTVFGIIVAVTWGEYNYSNSYYYDPQILPSSIEEVSFVMDIGSININYNTTPTNYYVKIDLDIKIKGAFVAGKSFSDFFKPIIWINNSISTTTFSLEKKPSTWFLFPLIQKISISITLRTDIIYDISALVSTGSVEMNVPEDILLNNTKLVTSTGSVYFQAKDNSVFFGNMDMSASTGSISLFAKKANFTYGFKTVTSTGSLNLNLTNCIIGEDTKARVSTGSITLKSYNTLYDKDCVWDIETNTGSIDVEIYQYTEMGANITGTLETSTGNIDLIYIDNQVNVGASFFGSWSTGSFSRSSSGGGFSPTNYNPFYSLDYNTASSTYTFDLTVSTGSIDVDGTSI